jgi:DnaJ-class molecular chaperone
MKAAKLQDFAHSKLVVLSARWLAILLSVLILSFTLVLSGASAATTSKAKSRINFDHNKTGFLLNGSHDKVTCVACHTKGVFKGTPRDCASCHVQNGRASATSKPSQHIPTSDTCEVCHKTTNFLQVSFTHNKVSPGSCSTCHNNTSERGKPAQHIQPLHHVIAAIKRQHGCRQQDLIIKASLVVVHRVMMV